MSQEQRLDRLERLLLFVVRAGARERKAIRGSFKETDEKINALIDAQMRHESEYAQYKQKTDEAMTDLARVQAETRRELSQFGRRTDEEMVRLTRVQAETAESLKALIATVDRMARERGNGQV
jgi:hypothetical protein